VGPRSTPPRPAASRSTRKKRVGGRSAGPARDAAGLTAAPRSACSLASNHLLSSTMTVARDGAAILEAERGDAALHELATHGVAAWRTRGGRVALGGGAIVVRRPPALDPLLEPARRSGRSRHRTAAERAAPADGGASKRPGRRSGRHDTARRSNPRRSAPRRLRTRPRRIRATTNRCARIDRRLGQVTDRDHVHPSETLAPITPAVV
jgi:hypothetical protein